MAKIGQGILGGISGKVAKVVGGKWKGVDYIRGWVKPTVSQEPQAVAPRTNMKNAMEYGKSNNDSLLKEGFKNVVKGKALSPINRFIKNNVTGRNFAEDFDLTQWSEGNVTPPMISDATHYLGDNKTKFTFLPNLSGYASNSDKIRCFVSCGEDYYCDVFDMLETDTRGTYAAKAGTGMYRILSAKKTTISGKAVCYLHVYAIAANGDCSLTATTQLNFENGNMPVV
jgi:hypothetical protein